LDPELADDLGVHQLGQSRRLAVAPRQSRAPSAPANVRAPEDPAKLQDRLIKLATVGAQTMIEGAADFPAWSAQLTAKASPVIEWMARKSGQTPEELLREVYGYAAAVAGEHGVKVAELPARQASVPPTAPGETGAAGMANAVYRKLSAGESLGNVTELNKLAEQYFGAGRTSGAWTPEDAFDAMEAGINKYLIERAGRSLMEMPFEQAMGELRALMERITSQGTRTEEQVQKQQFSTPPTESFLAARVAAVNPADIVLEPSAGNGGLAVWPKAIGATVHVNEVSERRQRMLEIAGFGASTSHDGEVINALLDPAVQPTLVIMNPPFTAGVVKSNQGKNNSKFGFNHVESALQRLAPGGRLVAILGGGQANEPEGGASLRGVQSGKWFQKLAQLYNLRANVRIDGREYQKYGTNFATRIIVIDKDGPLKSWSTVVSGNAATLDEAYNLLKDVAASRPALPSGAGNRTGPGTGLAPTGVGAGEDTGSPERPGVHPGQPGGGPPAQLGARTGPAGPDGGAGGLQPGQGNQPAAPEQPATEPAGAAGSAAPENAGGGNPHLADQRPLTGGEGSPGLDLTRDEQPLHTSDEEDSAAYVKYRPTLKGPAHPGDIVETKTMATVPMPVLGYKPNLPESILSEGRLSAVQLEAVAIAGQQNSIVLPDGSYATALIGDGTGVGKGRISAAVLYDNFRQGRKRLVWVSEKWPLMDAAIADLENIGAAELLRGVTKGPRGTYVLAKDAAVKGLRGFSGTAKIQHEGVLYTTYALIRSEDSHGNRRSAQLDQWLRGDDEGEGGYILFDESHNLKNAVAVRGGQVSKIGERVNDLLHRLPKLRTVSCSNGRWAGGGPATKEKLMMWSQKNRISSPPPRNTPALWRREGPSAPSRYGIRGGAGCRSGTKNEGASRADTGHHYPNQCVCRKLTPGDR